MAYRVAAYLIVFLVSITTAHAEPFKDLFPSKSYQNESVQQFVESLDYQQGRIKLAETGVELQVARNFYFWVFWKVVWVISGVNTS